MKTIAMHAAILTAAFGASGSQAAASDYGDLVELFSKWRDFEPPVVEACVPDFAAE